MAYITDYQYYENSQNVPQEANWGSYQYVSLDDIVNNFMLMYQGNNELINNINRYQVLFFAKRAIQELNYDAMKEIKILELQICDQLRFVLPPDYVNWVRISLYHNGVLLPMVENIQTNWSGAYLQDHKCRILFDIYGNVLKPEQSKIDMDRLDGTKKSIYLNKNSPYNGKEGWCINGCWYFDYPIGARFGLNTETANSNPTFSINKKGGAINFSSGVAGKLVILEYVSDGLEKGDDSNVNVNKLFEEFIYAAIKFSFLNNRSSAPEYVVNRARKDRSSLLRNAKLRISNMHPGRLLMNLRGQAKWIK
tara:strand:- start:15224 stop:16147 length:924 start_codon:yes stop_codon:yes gene_type:complete